MKINFFNKKGNKSTLDIDEKNLEKQDLSDALLQYLHVYFSNKRQGNSKVKNRSEVRGGGRKPWRQKGTGRARHGSIRSPLWVGGGVTHGPSPKDWKKRFNRKLKEKVFRYVLNDVFQNKEALVIDYQLKKPSTKKAKNYLKDILKEDFENKRVLLVVKEDKNLIKSVRNLQSIDFKNIDSLNTFDLMKADSIIFTAQAFESLKNRIN